METWRYTFLFGRHIFLLHSRIQFWPEGNVLDPHLTGAGFVKFGKRRLKVHPVHWANLPSFTVWKDNAFQWKIHWGTLLKSSRAGDVLKKARAWNGLIPVMMEYVAPFWNFSAVFRIGQSPNTKFIAVISLVCEVNKNGEIISKHRVESALSLTADWKPWYLDLCYSVC